MGVFDENDTKEMLNNLIKVGEVSSVNPTNGTARVIFYDDDSLVSGELQVIHTNTQKNKDFAMPDIGELVVCIFLASGTEEGFILGSVYTEDDTLPESSLNKRTIVFEDKTKISYDRSSHELTVVIDGTTITANRSSVTVVGAAAVNVEASKITLKGSVTIDGTLTTTGSVDVSGDVTASGNVTAADVVTSAVASQNAHTHTTTAPGDPTSAPNG